MFKEKDNLEKKQAEKSLIDHNLQMLNTDLLNLLAQESVGGNAGNYNIDEKNIHAEQPMVTLILKLVRLKHLAIRKI